MQYLAVLKGCGGIGDILQHTSIYLSLGSAQLTKRSAISTEVNDPGQHLPANETHVVYNCFSSELLISVGPRRGISKRKEK